MNNQLAKPDIENPLPTLALRGLAVLCVLILVVVLFYKLHITDPYITSVLSLNGDAVKGHAIFQINCAGCHGLEGQGRVGPSLDDISKRKSRVSLIHQVISGQTPPMPQFQPSPQEMADLLKYLEKF